VRLVKRFRVTTLRGDVFEVVWTPDGLEAFHNGKQSDTRASNDVIYADAVEGICSQCGK
jgi:hypothetical protein